MRRSRRCISRRSKSGNKYRQYTWTEYRDTVRDIACGLRSLGIGKGDIVALHSETRAEFYLFDMGVVTNGSIAAALYTSLPPGDHVRTLAVAEPKALVVEDPKIVCASAAGRRSGARVSLGSAYGGGRRR